MKKILLLFCLFPALLFAQSGIIEGRVFDEINNEPIIGANVIIKTTAFGATTDIDGNKQKSKRIFFIKCAVEQ